MCQASRSRKCSVVTLSELTLFVASSSETRRLVRGLELNFKDDNISVLKWSTMAWPPSRDALTAIEAALDEADFAAFILAPDDVAIIRGEEVDITRDNVVLELGMSLGELGRDRTFILAPKVASRPRKPSDLLGIQAIQYETDESNVRKAMSSAATQIWEQIDAVGSKPRTGSSALERGSTSRIETVADGALHVFASRSAYSRELKEKVVEGQMVPAKFQFAEAEGGRHWLKLCRSPNYQYFNQAKAVISENKGQLADCVRDAVGGTAIDLVSLGSGDGTKDEMLLRALADPLEDQDFVYYYPIDISDLLLVEAVRHVSSNGLKRERYRCKPVLGDFTNLSSLEEIIAYRPHTNLFSLLGNALGSFDEADILSNIKGAMRPGDLVLIEANIGEPKDSIALLEGDAANQWDLSTLDALKIDRDSCVLKQEESKRRISDVPGTRTLISYAVPHEKRKKKYLLSAMHHYDFDLLKKSLAKELDVELISEISCDGVGLLLGRRPD